MTRGKQYVQFLAVVFLFCGAVQAAAPDRAAQLFQHDVHSAWQAARATQRPLLLFVTMRGCHYCDRMLQTTYRDPAVTGDLQAAFVSAKLDRSQDPSLVKRLGVRVFPTTVIIDPNGSVRDSISGYQNPAQLRQRLRSSAPRP